MCCELNEVNGRNGRELSTMGWGHRFADEHLATWIGENFLHRLRTRVFAHLHTLSAGFFDRVPGSAGPTAGSRQPEPAPSAR